MESVQVHCNDRIYGSGVEDKIKLETVQAMQHLMTQPKDVVKNEITDSADELIQNIGTDYTINTLTNHTVKLEKITDTSNLIKLEPMLQVATQSEDVIKNEIINSANEVIQNIDTDFMNNRFPNDTVKLEKILDVNNMKNNSRAERQLENVYTVNTPLQNLNDLDVKLEDSTMPMHDQQDSSCNPHVEDTNCDSLTNHHVSVMNEIVEKTAANDNTMDVDDVKAPLSPLSSESSSEESGDDCEDDAIVKDAEVFADSAIDWKVFRIEKQNTPLQGLADSDISVDEVSTERIEQHNLKQNSPNIMLEGNPICDNTSIEITHRTNDKQIFNEKSIPLTHTTPYTCDNCDYSTKLLKNLIKHRSKHKIAVVYECNECNYTTKHRYLFKSHMKEGHTTYKCCYCNYLTELKRSFIKHQKIHKAYACDKCDFVANWPSLLRRHKVEVHNVVSGHDYKCKKCNFTSKLRVKFIKHCKVHVTCTYDCSQCKYSCSAFDNMVSHKKTHDTNQQVGDKEVCDAVDAPTGDKIKQSHLKADKTKETLFNIVSSSKGCHTRSSTNTVPKTKDTQSTGCKESGSSSKCNDGSMKQKSLEIFRCTKCHFTTKKLVVFTRHKASHQKEHKCDRCKFSTPWGALLTQHRQIHNYNCAKCGFECALRDEMQEHTLTAHNSYKCNQCEYSSTQYMDIMKHTHTHTQPQTEYSCDICDYSSTVYEDVDKHIQTHSQTFINQTLNQLHEYQCDKCGYASTVYEDVVKHVETHSSEYKCNECEYSSKVYEDLVKHMETHTRDYKCNKCEYSSKVYQDVVQHVESHSREYTCNECEYSSKVYDDVLKHVATHS